MIKYRPHKSTLAESMTAAKNFNTFDEMYTFIVSDLGEDGLLFSTTDICVGECSERDPRIDWKENKPVYIKRMGNQPFETPRCIGYCCIE